MDTAELIIITELYKNSRIEPSFIDLLTNEGLIEIRIIEGEQYIEESKLNDLERFARWYYDLSINIEGIDVIQNLLYKINSMENELNDMKRFWNQRKEDWFIEE